MGGVTLSSRGTSKRSTPRSSAKGRSKPPSGASPRGQRRAASSPKAEPRGHQADLAGLLLLAAAAVFLLSFLSVLGTLGRDLDRALAYMFGPVRVAAYVLLAVVSVFMILDMRARLPRRFRLSASLGLWALAAELSGWSVAGKGASMAARGGALGHYTFTALAAALSSEGSKLVLALAMLAFFFDALGHSPIRLVRRLRGPLLDSLADRREQRAASRGLRRTSGEEDEQEAVPAFLERFSEPSYESGPAGIGSHEKEVAGEAGDSAGEEALAPLPAEVPAADPDSAPAASAAGKVAWKLPAPTLLKRSVSRSLDKDELWRRGKVLSEALATHKVETSLVGMTVGPTVTRYELELGSGVKVARVTSLHKDIAYAMAAADVRILAPIPGRSAIGVEVPNHKRVVVALADVLLSPEADANTHPLAVAAGRDISGKPVLINLAEMPHILIAGATGSGKSSCLNSILTSILMRSTPEQVRLILVDPKRVELGQYNGVPHLLTPVVTNPKKAANALAWAVKEMERRYDMLSELGARDIYGYNQIVENMGAEDLPAELAGEVAVEAGPAPLFDESTEPRYARLPFILVVVDELNDLMMVAARDVEESICRIAQMARAVGIHLVIATQRPSVDVITGLIKANIPSRMAFSVSSLADSRVILDQPGAERLVGKGDMLFLGASSSHPQRIQSPWVSEEEVRKVVASWVRQGKASYLGEFNTAEAPAEAEAPPEDEDELFQAAMELVVNSQLGSTSMLQRKLKVGFSRAGRLMDLLERHGVVGPLEGSKPRVVLMSKEELENYLESHG